MELVEIRDLDGPNLFAVFPVVRITVADAGESIPPDIRRLSEQVLGTELPPEPLLAMTVAIRRLHAIAGLPEPWIGSRELDTPGHQAISFGWEWRAVSLAIAQLSYDAVSAGLSTDPENELRSALDEDRSANDRPLWVRDADRQLPVVGITGTNGKTTTTRLLSHILREAGKRVGWSSSSGVYIEGEQVLQGDYTGPSGGRRVLEDPTIDIAVLETARGGILLRGVAYESNDVGVFINISADHLGLHGVSRLETLAEVKSVVVRVTRPEGTVVLNADDPLVAQQRRNVRASVLLTSQQPGNQLIDEHVGAGGQAIVREGEAMVRYEGGERRELIPLAEVPVTFGGAAGHMVENALAAAGAALALGLSPDQVAKGLRSFRSDTRLNTGRLNVFKLDGRLIVVDYAHNESGLEALIGFTRSLMDEPGQLIAVIGTAGDRQDEVFRSLGQIAGARADLVYIKSNPRYLRGREAGGEVDLMRAGLEDAGAPDRLAGVESGETQALIAALEASEPNDAIAIMCVEEQLDVFRELRRRGAEEWG